MSPVARKYTDAEIGEFIRRLRAVEQKLLTAYRDGYRSSIVHEVEHEFRTAIQDIFSEGSPEHEKYANAEVALDDGTLRSTGFSNQDKKGIFQHQVQELVNAIPVLCATVNGWPRKKPSRVVAFLKKPIGWASSALTFVALVISVITGLRDATESKASPPSPIETVEKRAHAPIDAPPPSKPAPELTENQHSGQGDIVNGDKIINMMAPPPSEPIPSEHPPAKPVEKLKRATTSNSAPVQPAPLGEVPDCPKLLTLNSEAGRLRKAMVAVGDATAEHVQHYEQLRGAWTENGCVAMHSDVKCQLLRDAEPSPYVVTGLQHSLSGTYQKLGGQSDYVTNVLKSRCGG